MKKEKKTNRLANCVWLENQKCYLPKCETCPHLKEYIRIMRNTLTDEDKRFIEVYMNEYIRINGENNGDEK